MRKRPTNAPLRPATPAGGATGRALWAAVAAARAAKEAGRSVFQYMDVVSTIKGAVVPLIGAFATDEQGITKGKLGQAAGRRVLVSPIESYVYQQTHAESRDKFLASGQQEAYSGRILGIYTFRVIDDKPSTRWDGQDT